MKTILITGATSGIGLALAKKYLSLNYRVIITGRTPEKISAIEQELESYPSFIMAKNIDVTNKDVMSAFLLECDDKYRIDVVIANAGISASVTSQKDFDALAKDIFNVNVFGVFNTIHPLIERMKARQSGHLVIVSSLAAFLGIKDSFFYSASKSALKNYGEGLRNFLKPYHIDVTTIFPGFVDSNITRANKFKMPLFMDSANAANIIVTSLEHKKGYIVFPLRLYFFVYLIGILPFSIREYIISKLPNKGS